MKRVLAACAALCALGVPAAYAQGLGVGVGTLIPQGDLADGARSGLAAIASLELGSRFAFRAEGLWANSSLKGLVIGNADGIPLPSGAHASGDVRLIGALGSLVIHLASGPIQPYVLGGAGYYNRSVAQDAEDAAGDFRHLSLKESKVGVHLGAGLRIKIKSVAAFGEARYHRVNTDDAKTNFVPILVGVRIC